MRSIRAASEEALSCNLSFNLSFNLSRNLRRNAKKDAYRVLRYTAVKKKKYDKRREVDSLGRVTISAIYSPRGELIKIVSYYLTRVIINYNIFQLTYAECTRFVSFIMLKNATRDSTV